jgi:hypothetical protein
LKKFKKGNQLLGRTIEEIYVDIVSAQQYDPEDSETTLYKRTIPNVKTLFHDRNRQDLYPQTISDEQLRSAFTSWSDFGSFVAGIINAIYNSAEKDEFEYMKLLIDNYFSKGLFTVIPVTAPVDGASATDFVKKVRATATKMTLGNGSRNYNSLAVHTVTNMSDLHLIIDADLRAEMDVDVLADAFNMSKADFLGNVTVIDNFGSTGLEAVLIDNDWFMVFDNLVQLETARNQKGLYWNYFLHIWQTLSVSRFSNAVAFVSGNVNTVTSVIVNPAIANIKAGKTFEFTAYVRSTDGKDYPVSWTVSGSTSSTSVTGTTGIDANGVLTIDSTQTGELLVKANVTISDANVKTTLTANASANATSITVADTSEFSVGDKLLIGTETNAITIASIDSSTGITLSSGIVNAQTNGATVAKQVTVSGDSIITVA